MSLEEVLDKFNEQLESIGKDESLKNVVNYIQESSDANRRLFRNLQNRYLQNNLGKDKSSKKYSILTAAVASSMLGYYIAFNNAPALGAYLPYVTLAGVMGLLASVGGLRKNEFNAIDVLEDSIARGYLKDAVIDMAKSIKNEGSNF